MKNVVLIFGYNNTRIYDVERLKSFSADRFNADILLCKEGISDADRELTSYTLDVPLKEVTEDQLKSSVVLINDYLDLKKLKPVACLPFSDSGVPLGSYFASTHDLPHDDVGEPALACLDKFNFRQLEKDSDCPDWYKKPIFQKIDSLEQARLLVENSASPIFFKPTSEGNSRGCIRVANLNEFDISKALVEKYVEKGVIAEECIEGCQEYSFDGVNGQYIITEKTTSQGAYRVEIQHLLPAPLEKEDYNRLIQAGKIVCDVTGSNGGAAHHELFFNHESKNVYCVEPNRRPAGQKIWDAIDATYPGAEYWFTWLDWAAGQECVISEMKDCPVYTGIRMVTSRHEGILKEVDQESLSEISNKSGMITLELTKNIGDAVTDVTKDNSDFLGYFIFQHKSSDRLRELLVSIEDDILKTLQIR